MTDDGKVFSEAGLLSRITFTWASSTISKANQGEDALKEADAEALMPTKYNSEVLAQQFERLYTAPGACSRHDLSHFSDTGLAAWVRKAFSRVCTRGSVFRTMVVCHGPTLVLHSFITVCAIALRITSPLILRAYLLWLTASDNPPSWHGYLLAVALCVSALALAVFQHQEPWTGHILGLLMRQQAIAAIHAKLLRLNQAAVSAISPGFIINLVSNDVRRFDDGCFFWCFVWAAPIEVSIVLVLITLELDFPAAVAGIGVLFAMGPLQALLVRPVTAIRKATAQATDARVRLTSEAIQGALACKVLGWEEPLGDALKTLRAKEAAHVTRISRIRATNMTLQFITSTLATFAAFAVYQSRHGVLSVASVFYAASLLAVPRRNMWFFVQGVQNLSELRVSILRIQRFMDAHEPAPPANCTPPPTSATPTAAASVAASGDVAQQPCADSCVIPPRGTVVMTGAEYDWQRPFGAEEQLQQFGAGALDVSVHAGPGSAPSQPSDAISTAKPLQPAGVTSGMELTVMPQPPLPQALPGPSQQHEGHSSSNQHLTLAGVRVVLQPGELLGVCGEVGSGKSSLLATLLGELQPLDLGSSYGGGNGAFEADSLVSWVERSGRAVLAVGTLAYCAQVPWVVSGTLRDNILFGQSYDSSWYQRMLRSCVLEEDVGRLVAGDLTELGERGVNLSGGQKARLALARAAYQRPDVVLLDDPLSAVDARVARALFQECISHTGVLKGSTRILVTHQRQFLPLCDRVLVLRAGRPVALAPWTELQSMNLPEIASADTSTISLEDIEGDIADKSKMQDTDAAEARQQERERNVDSLPVLRERTALPNQSIAPSASRMPLAWMRSFGAKSFRRMFSSSRPADTVHDLMESTKDAGSAQIKQTASGKLVAAESRTIGTVSWGVYIQYFQQMGVVVTVVLFLAIMVAEAASVAASWWLALWARSNPNDQSDRKWLCVYGLMASIMVVFGFFRCLLFFEAAVQAATRVHNIMVSRLLRAPLAFFHTNPAGRVLNRFSKDQGCVDDMLPSVMFDAIQSGLQVLGSLVLVCVAVPFVLPVFIPLVAAFLWLRARYLAASREVKRWEAVTRSPVYASFSSDLKGLSTIRAYGVQVRFHEQLLQQLTSNTLWNFAFYGCGRWLGFRLDLLVGATMLAAPLIAVAVRNQVDSALMGLALSNLLQMTGGMQWFVRQTAEVENYMTCVERMLEYVALPQEPPRVCDGAVKPPPPWPQSGALTWECVSARYRPGLPEVLQEISFTLQPGSICGVVGRTGSGKSSLALTLFRLIEVTHGRVLLDGVDVATIGLDALRSQLAIIPQDPVLFSGTVRSNLDPWGRHPDSALWEVLATVEMRRCISALGGLSARLVEGGDNLSVGQRQLFCLARALLQNAQVLILDEATANVDRDTDALIHRALYSHVKPHEHHTATSTAACALKLDDSRSDSDRSSDCDSSATLEAAHPASDEQGAAGRRVHGGRAVVLQRQGAQMSATPGPLSKLGGKASGKVLLVIAHRIDTIMSSDHLLVLGGGRLLEQGPPQVLASQAHGRAAKPWLMLAYIPWLFANVLLVAQKRLSRFT